MRSCWSFPERWTLVLGPLLFWVSLGASLILAGVAAFPVNRWLISKGKGHAVVHAHSTGTAKTTS